MNVTVFFFVFLFFFQCVAATVIFAAVNASLRRTVAGGLTKQVGHKQEESSPNRCVQQTELNLFAASRPVFGNL